MSDFDAEISQQLQEELKCMEDVERNKNGDG
jgi:hypothetical protein